MELIGSKTFVLHWRTGCNGGQFIFFFFFTFATGSPPIVATIKMSTKWRPDSARMLLLAVKNRREPLGRIRSVSSKVSPKKRAFVGSDS